MEWKAERDVRGCVYIENGERERERWRTRGGAGKPGVPVMQKLKMVTVLCGRNKDKQRKDYYGVECFCVSGYYSVWGVRMRFVNIEIDMFDL